MLATFWEWVHYLNSAQLVRKFQVLCGIEIVEAVHNGTPEKNGSPQKQNFTNDSNDLLNKEDLIKYSMQNNVTYKIQNRFLYYLFHLGAFLGNEEFLASFFAWCFWNFDAYILRCLLNVWMCVMYIGQALKDVICWPRPQSPPVAKLEKRYVLEYGMPSTHAMSAYALPYTLWVLCMDRHDWSWAAMCTVFSFWCVITTLSRIYLGMHSWLDVIVGLLISLVLCPFFLLFVHNLDDMTLHWQYGHIAWASLAAFMAYCYPTLSRYSTTRSDTFLALACSIGLSLGCRIGSYWNVYVGSEGVTSNLNFHWFLLSLLRMLIGMPIAVVVKESTRIAVYKLLCFLYGLPRDQKVKNRELFKVELPYMFSQYILMGFTVAILCPYIYACFGINRSLLSEM